MSVQNQQTAQLLRIVQLAVVHHMVVDSPEEEIHGLSASRQVYDSQPGMEEAEPLLLEDAPLIRSPPCHGFQHPLQDLPVFSGGTQNSCNCAHKHHNPFQAHYSLFRCPGSVNGEFCQEYRFQSGAP